MSNIMKEKIAKLKLDLLDWAPKSPDLNRIEMLWSVLDIRNLLQNRSIQKLH